MIENSNKASSAGKAWQVYLQGIAAVLPAFIVLSFAGIFLIPKLEWIWQHAGLDNSKVQWLMNNSYFLTHFTKPVFGLLCIVFILLEILLPDWQRYRRAAVMSAMVIFNTLVLIAVTIIATAAMIAAPLLTSVK